jgi:hypothetical protein
LLIYQAAGLGAVALHKLLMNMNPTPDPTPLKEQPDSHNILFEKIESPKILDLIVSKQTQYYTLWGVYTAVQFAARWLPIWWEIVCGSWPRRSMWSMRI